MHEGKRGRFASRRFRRIQPGTTVTRRYFEHIATALHSFFRHASSAEYFLPSVSPNGSRLTFSPGETPRVEKRQMLDLRSGAIVKPVTAGIRAYATWLPPDGRFVVGNGSSGEMRWMRTDRSEAAGTLLAIPDAVLLPSGPSRAAVVVSRSINAARHVKVR